MVETVTVLRSLHILFAVLWAGAGIHFQVVSRTSMEERGTLLHFLAHSKHGPFMGLTALGTVGFGLATWLINGGEAYTTAGNAVLGIGALAAIIATLVGFGGHLPNSVKAKEVLQSGDEAAQGGVLRKESMLDKVSLLTIAIALVAMLTFRWF